MRPTAVLSLGVVLVLSACHPDPTRGDPPPRSADVAPFTVTVESVTREELGASWRPGCPVHHSRLRAVTFPHWNYSGVRRMGRLIVHRAVVDDIGAVFERLYDRRFQVRQVRPVSAFGGDDDRSMRANNTSAFNCRYVGGTTTWSQHAYGRAVDVNPIQNPYVRDGRADPPDGWPWIDRRHGGPGMAMPGNVLVSAFRDRGWGWGGAWSGAKDYQHFSQNGR